MVITVKVSHNLVALGHRFFIFCFTDFFRDKLGSEDEIKILKKIHSDHFPIELKSKETRNPFRVSFDFISIGICFQVG